MTINGVLETSLYVDDLEDAERFYHDVMGLEAFAKVPGRHVFFRCGAAVLLVFHPGSTAKEVAKVGDVSIPLHGALGPGHVAFAVGDADLEAWIDRLTRHEVDVEAEVTWPGGGRSIYFRDPAGNSLELASPRIWGIEEATEGR
jgi:catechol 2,3-dioxygenase-like lactoylglutathione lyase family enzyme